MGRSPSLCFRIKACAGDAAGNDEASPLPESKTSPDKRRWSFRKRSAGHHVPSNTVILDPLPILSEKQNQKVTADTSYSEKAPSDPEKVSSIEQINETYQKPQLPSAVVSSRVPEEFTHTVTIKVDKNIPEHVVVAIQTSIRGCLAKKELQKLKNVVKLQAAARGYLVRRQAAGTLRCIQAIIKLQALVRTRRSVQLAEFTANKKFDEYMPADVGMQSNKTSAISKLVSSVFARQLLESIPKTKPIHISCDPLRPNSAWNWLERWMALAAMDQQKLVLNQDGVKTDLAAYDVDVGLHVKPENGSSDSDLTANAPGLPEVDGDLITKGSRMIEVLAPAFIPDQCPFSPVQDDEQKSRVKEAVAGGKDKYITKRGVKESSDYIASQIPQSLAAGSNSKLDDNSNKPVYAEDAFKNSSRKDVREATDTEGDKVVTGSRKSKNSAFAAVQAQFEELSSASGSNRSLNNSLRDAVSESKPAHSQVDSTSKEVGEERSVCCKADDMLKQVNIIEKLVRHNSEDQGTASAYGTETSVCFSLDRSEAPLAEFVPENRTLIETNHGVYGGCGFEELKAETKGHSSELDAVQSQRMAESSRNAAIPIAAAEPVQLEQQLAETTTSSQIQVAEDTQVHRSSLDGSPRSHTAVESSNEPSSQVSLHEQTANAENDSPARKKRSQLVVMNSPTNSKNDSDTLGSGEHVRKDRESVKRPKSKGASKTDHIDHQNRISGNSLPSYMQPTESAKAKVNTSFSRKSSPDLHDKDNNVKKRHSLPTGDGKQGSPLGCKGQHLKNNNI